MKIASNLFAAGQETTARLLSSALKIIGDRPEIQQQLRDDRDLVPVFIEEMLRLERPIKGTFRLAQETDHHRRDRDPGRDHGHGAARRGQP